MGKYREGSRVGTAGEEEPGEGRVGLVMSREIFNALQEAQQRGDQPDPRHQRPVWKAVSYVGMEMYQTLLLGWINRTKEKVDYLCLAWSRLLVLPLPWPCAGSGAAAGRRAGPSLARRRLPHSLRQPGPHRPPTP